MERKKHIAKVIIDISYLLKRDLDNAAAKFGLTRMQAVMLKFLETESVKRDVFQKDIEREFRIRKSSVTSVIQLLEKNGYITRESVNEDARLKKIVLTDKARNVNSIIGNGLDRREEKFYDVLSEEEIENFFFIMNKISSVLE
jgi:DNA-binding MarR family transcriptional regulator